MRNLSLVIVLVALAANLSSARYNSFGSFFRRSSPLEMLMNADKNDKDVAGGWNCAICTILIYESEIYSTLHNETIDQFLENDLCKLFKDPLNSLCVGFINEYGADIIDALKNDSSPDDACLKVGLCNNPQCRAVPKTNSTMNLRFSTPENLLLLPGPKKFDPFQELMKILEEFSNNHRPDVDFDNDTYSQFTAQARGFNWKGKDCDDLDKDVHPGRGVGKDPSADFGCTGITGRNESNNVPYRQELCNNTNMMGIAVIGDSVGAHFELPPDWFNGSAWNSTTFDDFVPRALDEFDLPELSGWTGYFNNITYSHSLYQYMFGLNHCNMRDYQNAGVNGATSYNVIPDVTDGSFKRDQENDEPVLLILELVGNDVCGGFPYYTNVSDFNNNLIDILNFFDTMLPTGSHVLLVGLANGSLLYETMWNQTHPTGLTYVDVYDYLMCLDISPCPGWLNSNDTTRANTTAQAVALTQVLQDIVNSGQTWQHFDLAFYDFPANPIMNAWIAQGNNPIELIEPVDGFHPSQTFHSLMADWFWENFQANQSSWLGSPNPNNLLITQLFGDQGGYGY